MADNVKLQHDYQSQLLADVPVTSTGEIAIPLSIEIDSEMGFIIIDRGINLSEERMFFHRKNQNTIYVYSENRVVPKKHTEGANVILDSISTINYTIDNTIESMYVFKKSNSDIIVKGGTFFINGEQQNIDDLDSETGTQHLVSGQDNYIYIQNNNYLLTTSVIDTLFPVAIVSVEVGGNISNIEMINAQIVSNGITTSERDKLSELNKNDYEKLINKVNSVDETSTDDQYPTAKLLYDKTKNLVSKDGDKVLSDNNYTNSDKDKLQDLYNMNLGNINFETTDNKRGDIRPAINASTTDYVNEKGIALTLEGYVKKENNKGLSKNDYTDADKINVNKISNKVDKVDGKGLSTNDYTDADRSAVITISNKVDKVNGKELSDNNLTDELLDKINNLSEGAKTNVEGGTGILVTDLGDNGWKVSSDLNTTTSTTGEYIDVSQVDDRSKEIYIDEERYVVLGDTNRSGVTGKTKFKDAKSPSIKVFYHNPNNEGKVLIDTHIRIVDSNGMMNEQHKSIPYLVDVKKGHGVFLLGEESFRGLNYNNSNVIMVKVHRVGAWVTDHNGTQFNTVLNDLDTVIGDLRIKSMYVDYEQIIDDKNTITGFTGTLKDSTCNDIAIVENGIIKNNISSGNNESDPTVNGVIGILSNVSITGATLQRTLDGNDYTENNLIDLLFGLITDLQSANLIQVNESTEHINVINDLKDLDYDADNTTVPELADVLATLIKVVQSKFKCSEQTINKPESINVDYVISNYTESTTFDRDNGTLDQFKDIVLTLINDLNDANVFNGGVIQKIDKSYSYLNPSIKTNIIKNENSLYDLYDLFYKIILDLKNTNIIK